jgi:hypothetical protein
LPIAESLARTVLSLPISPELEEDEIDVVAHEIRNFYSGIDGHEKSRRCSGDPARSLRPLHEHSPPGRAISWTSTSYWWDSILNVPHASLRLARVSSRPSERGTDITPRSKSTRRSPRRTSS